MPALIYDYFNGMRATFKTCHRLLAHRAKAAFVVGPNVTTIHERPFRIDTPALLATLGNSVGLHHLETIELDTYARYGLHSQNSIKAESLVIFEKP